MYSLVCECLDENFHDTSGNAVIFQFFSYKYPPLQIGLDIFFIIDGVACFNIERDSYVYECLDEA